MSDKDVPDDVAGDDVSDAAADGVGTAVPLSKSGSARQAPAEPLEAVGVEPVDEASDIDSGSSSNTGLDSDIDAEVDSDDGVAGDREPVAVGARAATAGSARAAARRAAAVRAGVTERKGTATRTRDTERDDRGNLWQRLLRFLREVVAELRKVIWPARNQMVTYTIVVIVFVVIMVALVAGLDLLFAKGVLSVFG